MQFHERGLASRAFPWWGWFGVALTGMSWWLAWNRFTWFEPLQPFIFTPLWLGYILLVNAYTFTPHGTLHVAGQAPPFSLAVSSQLGILVVIRVSESLRAQLVFIWECKSSHRWNIFSMQQCHFPPCFPPYWARWSSWHPLRGSAQGRTGFRRFGASM